MLEEPPEMSAENPMDEITDLIANIEMHRQEIARESGLEASRNYALGRLRQELLPRQEESRLQGPSPERLAHIEALSAEIRRVETLAGSAGQREAAQRTSAPRHRQSRRDMPRQPNQSRGRRNMGRRSGR
jgi:hypothetical protein